MRWMLVVMILGTVCVGTACGGAQRDADTLTESVRVYNEGIRWNRFAAAAKAILPAERGQFVDDMDQRADDLKITDYEVVRVDNSTSNEAKVQVKLSWYLDSEGRLFETHAVQTWERRDKRWWMVDETRLRGHEMPGLTEPVELEPAAVDAVPSAATPRRHTSAQATRATVGP